MKTVQWSRFVGKDIYEYHTINFRNHRKFFVIDGKVSYLSGFNICKEYLTQVAGLDTGLQVKVYKKSRNDFLRTG
jgi:phosphatidylserine/phosphatidylglycerophosphate/cardiolipin synthase-like enzyme